MAVIPFQGRRRSIPGGGNIPFPRADAQTFGAGVSRAVASAAEQIGTVVGGIVDKKNTDDADLFVASESAAMRRYFATRRTELRVEEKGGDISPRMVAEMEDYKANVLSRAPNNAAALRMAVSADSINGSYTAKIIAEDDAYRQNRLIRGADTSHEDNLATAYSDFSSLEVVIASSDAVLENLKKYIDPTTIDELKLKHRYELGLEAVTGLIDTNAEGADKALMLLNDPKGGLNDMVKTTDRQKLIKYAETSIRTHQAQADLAIARGEKQRAVVQRTEHIRLMDIFMSEEGLSSTVLSSSVADPEIKRFYMSLIRQEAEGAPPPSAPERSIKYTSLVEKINITHPDDVYKLQAEIYQAREFRYIGDSEFKSLLKRLNEPHDAARNRFESMLKTRLTKTNPLYGLLDPKGDELYMKAMLDVQEAVRLAKKEDIPIYKLFDHSQPEYIGPALNKYQRTMNEIVADMAALSGPEITPTPTPEVELTDEEKKIRDDLMKRLGLE
jgi:hypothetical protein